MKPFFVVLIFVFGALSGRACANERPLDGWTMVRVWSQEGNAPGQISNVGRTTIGVGFDNAILVSNQRAGFSHATIFRPDGSLIREVPVGNPSPLEIRNQNIVYSAGSQSLQRLNVSTGVAQVQATLATAGTGVGQLGDDLPSITLEFGPTGKLHVLVPTRGKILIFDENDVFLREIGEFGVGVGKISGFCSELTVDALGRLWLRNGSGFPGGQSIDIYSDTGELVRTIPQASSWLSRFGPVMISGVSAQPSVPPFVGIANVLDLGAIPISDIRAPAGTDAQAAASGPNGLLVALITLDGKRLATFTPAYRTSWPLVSGTTVPLIHLTSVSPRSGTTILDVRYRIVDSDSATATVQPLAFINGIRSLSNLVRMDTLVDGTASNVGSGVTVGPERLISWNAAADYAGSGIANASVVLFANDGRGIVDLGFVTVPANIPNSGDPALTILSAPLSDADVLEAWFWLVAMRDAAITFVNGEVRGVGGAFDGQLLASGTTTTSEGRSYLFQRLGTREATPAEVLRARTGTTPGVQQYGPLKRVGDVPLAINEIGVDTGAMSGYWLVKL